MIEVKKPCIVCGSKYVPRYNHVQTQKYCGPACRQIAHVANQNRCWFTYVDYRLDTFQPFYVGVGNTTRVNLITRNQRHKHIAKKYGLKRELVFCTSIRQLAVNEEIRLIKELKTRDTFGGANFTDGGEGNVGWNPSKITRKRIGIANAGRQISEHERKQRSARLKGKFNPNYGNRVERIKIFCAHCLLQFFERASRHSKFCSRICFVEFLSKTRKSVNNPNHKSRKGLS